MAKFVKGKPKTGGRTKGTKNRTTQEMRDFLQKVLDKQLLTLEDDLLTMSVGTRWQIWDKLSSKIMPNLQKSDDTINHSGNIQVSINFEDSLGLNDNDTESEDIDI